MSRYTVTSSDGSVLQFEDFEMYEQYNAEKQALLVKYYKKIREKHGIWASNQGKFVASPLELNSGDSKVMENLLTSFERNERAN